MTCWFKGVFLRNSWWIFLIVGLLTFACKNENCISVRNNELLIRFLKADTTNTGEVTVSDLDTVFMRIMAAGSDTVFYDSMDEASVFRLPVDPSATFTAFRFDVLDSIVYDTVSTEPLDIDTIYYESGRTHILEVNYEKRYRVISEDCGAEISYWNLTIDTISFPFYQQVEDQLSRFNEANIEIYY